MPNWGYNKNERVICRNEALMLVTARANIVVPEFKTNRLSPLLLVQHNRRV